MKALPPLMTYSSPCSSARVLSEPASEPAPGSVRQYDASLRPLVRSAPQRSRTAGGAPGAEHPGRHVVDGDEGGGRRIDRGHLLEHQRGVEARQRQAADALGRIEAAEAQFAGLGDRVLREDRLGVPARGVRREFALRELARRLARRRAALR